MMIAGWIVALVVAVAILVQALVLRWIWLDREQMRLERKAFLALISTEVAPQRPEVAAIIMEKWNAAREMGISHRGRKEGF